MFMILLPNQKSTYPLEPGVYRMTDKNQKIIYIGKAKNLRNRLTNYFDKSKKSSRIELMIKDIATIEVTTTATENDALMLEQKLITKLKPKYNIIFRDDKSYPFIALSKHKFPKIYITREKKLDLKKDNLFGPYPKREDAYKNIEFVQKIFKIRTCTDNELAHRSRPCVMHEIGKCSAPCVKQNDENFIKSYSDDISNAKNLLQGNIKLTISKIKEEMEVNSALLDFEAAAKNRDMINSLKGLNENQNIYSIKEDNLMVFNYFVGEKTYLGYAQVIEGIPQKIFNYEVGDELSGFSIEELLERYIDLQMVDMQVQKIITPMALDNLFYKSQHSHLDQQQKGWLKLVKSNLELIAGDELRKTNQQDQTVVALKQIFSTPIKSIDCIDISHFSGEATYGGKIRWSVVAGVGQLDKGAYRLSRFDDRLIDDVLHMGQTVEKIYHADVDFPDILIIDGDKPQMEAAYNGLKNKGLEKDYILMCSSKGVERKKGAETFYVHPKCISLINPQYMKKDILTLPKSDLVRLFSSSKKVKENV
jgi:excinuclease ABC subunit C